MTPQPVAGELLDGTRFDLASLAGRVVVVNFWASWCAPCRLETTELVATYQTTKDLGVAFVGVDVRDGRDAAKSFAEDFNMSYPSLFDPPGKVALAFRDVAPSTIPTTVIVDRSGIAATGPLLLGVAVAALAGLVSSFAPCMLPLVPGYLSYVTGLAGTDLAPTAGRELTPGSGDTVRPGQIGI